MCHRYDALPAITPIAGAAVDVEDLTLTASDGTQFAAFHARAESPTGPGMVILPDVRGLFRFYEELAIRFAEIGVDAVAIDYFGRTAGVSKRDAEFDFWPHVRATTPEGNRRRHRGRSRSASRQRRRPRPLYRRLLLRRQQ